MGKCSKYHDMKYVYSSSSSRVRLTRPCIPHVTTVALSMFRAVHSNARILAKAFAIVGELVDVATLRIDSSGACMQSMDGSHVSLVELTIPKEAFESFAIEGTCDLGIKTTLFEKVLSCCAVAPGSAMVELSHENDVISATSVSATSVSATSVSATSDTSRFSLRLLDVESDALALPRLETFSKISFDAAMLQRIVKDLTMFGDVATFAYESNRATLSAAGDVGTASVSLPSIDAITHAAYSGTFALRYLNTFAKGASLSTRVDVYFAPDMPLVVRYEFEKCALTFYLAPKIDDDE